VPVTMPPLPGSMGFYVPIWVGLGIVGIWASLDALSERAKLRGARCAKCGRRCVPARFTDYVQDKELEVLEELDDLRHLYAHNYAGDADDRYFKIRSRHVLASGAPVSMSCGATFNGRHVDLDLHHLRAYSQSVQKILRRFEEQ
jgi:hypothetical protein